MVRDSAPCNNPRTQAGHSISTCVFQSHNLLSLHSRAHPATWETVNVCGGTHVEVELLLTLHWR